MSCPLRLVENAINVTITVTAYTDCTETEPVDLTGATVAFTFIRPDRTIFTKAATVDPDPTTGKASYQTSAGDLDQAGAWVVRSRYTLATGIDTYDGGEMQFEVMGAPA